MYMLVHLWLHLLFVQHRWSLLIQSPLLVEPIPDRHMADGTLAMYENLENQG